MDGDEVTENGVTRLSFEKLLIHGSTLCPLNGYQYAVYQLLHPIGPCHVDAYDLPAKSSGITGNATVCNNGVYCTIAFCSITLYGFALVPD